MNSSRMSSMLASPLPAIPTNACAADHTTAPPMANSARAWNPSTSSVPTTSASRFIRLWRELVSCTVIAGPPFWIALQGPASSQLELIEALMRAAIVGGQGTVRREVLVAHVAETLPLVIVAHFAV